LPAARRRQRSAEDFGGARIRRRHHHVDVGLVEAQPRGPGERCRRIRPCGFLASGLVLEPPDVDHGVDAAFQIAQQMDHLAGALASEILERAGGVDVGRLGVDQVADLGLDALLAQGPGDLLDLLGGSEDVRDIALRSFTF